MMAESYSNISNAKTYSKMFGSFLGADYTQNELHISEQRAVEMQNIINRDGENQKRYGYTEILGFKGKQINGLWEIQSGNEKQIVIHVEKKFYKAIINSTDILQNDITIEEIGINRNYVPPYYESDDWNEYLNNSIKNELSYGIVKGNRLYIFCGIMLVYGKFNNVWELRAVRDNEDTYIPITTSNISHTKSDVNTRYSLDNVNLMSCRRINKLYGVNSTMFINADDYVTTTGNLGIAWANTYNKSWKGVLETNSFKVIINVYDKNNSVSYPNIEIVVNKNLNLTTYNEYITSPTDIEELNGILPNFKLKSTINLETNTINFSISTGVISEEVLVDLTFIDYVNFILDSNKIANTSKFAPKISILKDGLEQVYTFNSQGKIDGLSQNDSIVLNYETGVLSMFGNYLNDSIEPNISIEFTTEQSIKDKGFTKIDGCKFGAIFGYNNLDYLFISGNEEYPNYDWHTESTFSYTNGSLENDSNLTYFPDVNYCIYGSEQKKVISYSHLEDGILGVHKEYSPNEPNLYIKEPKLVNVIDSNGNEVLNNLGTTMYKVEFPTYSSAIGEGAISHYANGNLSGDKLILSANGVYGIELTSSVKTNERYAKERSRLINSKLTTYDLSKATSIVWNNMYYLSMNDSKGTVFVADARYRNRPQEEMNDTLSYEWWEWKNIPCRNWCVINNNLCFYTKNGKVCMFTENFIDKTFDKIDVGNITLNNNVFYYNNALELEKYKKIKIANNSNNIELYEKLFSAIDVEIYSYDENIMMLNENKYYENVSFYEDKTVYVVAEGINASTPYILKFIPSSTMVKLEDSMGNPINLKNKEFRVLRKLGEETFEITSNGFYIHQKYNNNPIEISSISEETFNEIYAYAVNENSVVSFWKMPATSFGDSGYTKIVKRIILTLNPVVNSSITLYLNARGKRERLNFQVEGNNNLSLEQTRLNNFNLDPTTELRSFSRKVNLRNINFLQMAFESNNDINCSVYSIVVEYLIVKKARGVM